MANECCYRSLNVQCVVGVLVSIWPEPQRGVVCLHVGKVRANVPSRAPPLQRAGGQETLPWLVVERVQGRGADGAADRGRVDADLGQGSTRRAADDARQDERAQGGLAHRVEHRALRARRQAAAPLLPRGALNLTLTLTLDLTP